MKKKAKRSKKETGSRPRTLSAGWGTFSAVAVTFCVILWFVLNPFLNPESHVLARLAIVLVTAAVGSAVATYMLNSVLAAWSKRRRRRS